jgi:hypothetical protein
VSIATDLATLFRTLWADRFEDTCVVKAISGETLNTTTGSYVVTYSTTYSGACLVRPRDRTDAVAGEDQHELRWYNVYIPYTTTSASVGDLVDVTSTADSWLSGRQLVVRNIVGDTYNHRRLLECEDDLG